MSDLFDYKNEQNQLASAPLADRMRPQDFIHFFGQQDVVGEKKLLRQLIESDKIPSLIFWGPPGSGKTTLAKIVANLTKSKFITLPAVTSGVADLRKVIKEAEDRQKLYSQKTILFVDELHRWNKSQQDALLPHVEKGIVILIGATTENPSFEVVGALLSRCRVIVLKKLRPEDILAILNRAIVDKERGLGKNNLKIASGGLTKLAVASDGDARVALNALEIAANQATAQAKNTLTDNDLAEALDSAFLKYDKAGEEHYNIISALHKSLRGSDVSASLYWLGRMLEAGEDPLYVARRLVRFASEDIGLADPRALTLAVSGYQAAHFIGMPECNVVLAEVVAYLAKAAKSNDLYEAYGQVQSDIKKYGMLPVPLHLRNAPTKLMKELGYGKDYKYNPEFAKRDEEVEQTYLPDQLSDRKYL